MRSLHTLLIWLAAAPVGAAEAYRWVDKDGVVHFSDRPAKGAETIPLTPAPRPGSIAPLQPRPTVSAPPAPSIARYNACAVTSPAADQTFMQADQIPVTVEMDPALQADDGITLTLNGTPIKEWPRSATASRIGPLPRGAYTLAATVTGPTGASKCTSSAVTFNVFQPSLLSPLRKPKPR